MTLPEITLREINKKTEACRDFPYHFLLSCWFSAFCILLFCKSTSVSWSVLLTINETFKVQDDSQGLFVVQNKGTRSKKVWNVYSSALNNPLPHWFSFSFFEMESMLFNKFKRTFLYKRYTLGKLTTLLGEKQSNTLEHTPEYISHWKYQRSTLTYKQVLPTQFYICTILFFKHAKNRSLIADWGR